MSELRERKREDRDFDVIIFGATSFAGGLVFEYFLKNYKQSTLRWTIAGRSKAKLEEVQKAHLQYSSTATEVVPIVADSSDRASLDKMTSRTRVILTTVGPYAKYGSQLVESCVQNKTHYVDLTGEPQWVRQMIDRHHEQAEKDKTLIVNMSGFDSIPSDIGTLMMVNHFRAKGGEATRVDAYFTEIKGGISGGTIASAVEMFENADLSKLANPYYLNPKSWKPNPNTAKSSDIYLPGYSQETKRWTAPFFMASVNTRVVRRSAALLQGEGYAPNFSYNEVMTHNPFVAVFISFALAAFGLIMIIPFTRNIVKRFLPGPGTGPSRKTIDSGSWKVEYVAKGIIDGKQVTARGSAGGHKDPGYGDTATLIAESAVHLAQMKEVTRGGVITPAAAFGPTFVDRLMAAGLDFQVDN